MTTRVYQVSAKHLYNICTMLVRRRRRGADIVQMLYKCFVFAGQLHTDVILLRPHSYSTSEFAPSILLLTIYQYNLYKAPICQLDEQ